MKHQECYTRFPIGFVHQHYIIRDESPTELSILPFDGDKKRMKPKKKTGRMEVAVSDENVIHALNDETVNEIMKVMVSRGVKAERTAVSVLVEQSQNNRQGQSNPPKISSLKSGKSAYEIVKKILDRSYNVVTRSKMRSEH
jgi:hypothetical protein